MNAENGAILSEVKTGHGIAAAFESWKEKNLPDAERGKSYKAYLLEQVKKITTSFIGSLETTPIILSGMASSSIGMLELPYKEIPFQCSGFDLVIHSIAKEEQASNKIIIISGARSENDVIRGEETMLAGCDVLSSDREQLFIFPGTHSKHLTVKNGLVKNITTYMTGELFDLLSSKSILSASVNKNDSQQHGNSRFFVEGVMEGVVSSLGNAIFHVRTNQLFRKTTPGENYHYLSGLLIGHELKNLQANKPEGITLVCGEGLRNTYLQAMDVLELNDRVQSKDADEALIKGQWKIMQHMGYL